MPLLMCPNCNVSTQQIRRFEVELDMCPQCRGVWLDRGELEKVLEMERVVVSDRTAPLASGPVWRSDERNHDHHGAWRHDDHDRHDERRSRGEHDGHGKKRFSLLDMFD